MSITEQTLTESMDGKKERDMMYFYSQVTGTTHGELITKATVEMERVFGVSKIAKIDWAVQTASFNPSDVVQGVPVLYTAQIIANVPDNL